MKHLLCRLLVKVSHLLVVEPPLLREGPGPRTVSSQERLSRALVEFVAENCMLNGLFTDLEILEGQGGSRFHPEARTASDVGL